MQEPEPYRSVQFLAGHFGLTVPGVRALHRRGAPFVYVGRLPRAKISQIEQWLAEEHAKGAERRAAKRAEKQAAVAQKPINPNVPAPKSPPKPRKVMRNAA